MPFEQIAGDYHLSLSAVHAAMAYYYDHQEAIDQRMSADVALADELERQSQPLSTVKKVAAKDG